MSVDVNVNIKLNSKGAEVAADKLSTKMTGLEKRFGRASRAFDSFIGNLGAQIAFRAISTVGNAMLNTVKNAAAFETALVGVGKTTNLQGKELEALGAEFTELSKKIPVATIDLLKLGQTAAQLGVKGNKNLIKFTETMARLQSATNIAGEEGAISMARLLNVTKTGIEDVDKVGSAIVDLGNNFEVMEGELLKTATSIGQATAQFGLGASDVLALGTALKSFGIEAELAGTNTGIIFKKMADAVATGGDELNNFADAAGVSAKEFSESFRDKPIEAFKLFTKGLADAGLEGVELTQTLQTLGLTNQRVTRVINAVVTGYDKYAAAVERADSAVQTNQKLLQESEAVFKTTDSNLQILENSWNALSKSIGKAILPFINGQIKEATDDINFWAQAIANLGLSDADKQILKLNDSIQKQIDKIQLIEAAKKKLQDAPGVGSQSDQADIRFYIKQLDLLNGKLNDTITQRNKLRGDTPEDDASPSDDDEAAKAAAAAKAKEDAKTAATRLGEEQRKMLLDAFRTETLEKDEASRLAQVESVGLLAEENFVRIQQQLGNEAALKLAADVKDLIREKKKVEALAKIRKADADARQKQLEAEERANEIALQNKVKTTQAAGTLLTTLAKDGSKEQFVISKAAALANAFALRGLALAQATAAAPPPLNVPIIAAAELQSNLAIATIAASALKGFQDGGVVGGNSFSGDNVLARVNSGEMILNRQQQARLFEQANGGDAGGSGSKEFVIHNTVELDGDVVAKSVSRKVADGLVLGENV